MRHLIAALVMLLPTAATRAGEWQPMLESDSLDGWTAMFGGSTNAWSIADGELRIERPGEGGWLRTTRMYRDFELELEVMIPEGGNSGIGLRCTSEGDPAFTGFEFQIHDSTTATRADFGAIYNAIPPATQAANAPGEWNTIRILLTGDTLNAWLNGQWVQQNQTLDERGIFRTDDQPLPLNERATTGYIAIQDHGEGGLRVRNVRIRDLSPDPDPGDFTHAFTDNSIDGWTHRGGGRFFIEDGTLIAADGPGHLFSNATHTDIEIHTLVRIARPEETDADRTGNSGIYFRTIPRPEDPDTWPLGYEAQLDHHDLRATNYTGCIYDAAPAQPGSPLSRDGAWFDYRIVATGDRIRTFINGTPMVDTTLSQHDTGHIAIQTHHEGNRVEFRDFRWRVPTRDE